MDVKDIYSGAIGDEQVIYGILGVDNTVLTFVIRLQSGTEVSNKVKELLKSIGITRKSDDDANKI